MRHSLALCLVFLIAIAPNLLSANPDLPKIETLSPGQAASLQAEILKGTPPDLSRVYITRLQIGQRIIDVASLQPALLAEEKRGEYWAVSVFAYNENKSALVLFSRDPQSGLGYRLKLPADKLKEGMVFAFPLLRGGTLEQSEVRVKTHFHRP